MKKTSPKQKQDQGQHMSPATVQSPVLMFPSPPESTLFQRGAALFGLCERSNRLKEGAKRKLIASDTPGGPA